MKSFAYFLLTVFIFSLLILIIPLLFVSCSPTEPEKQKLEINNEDVSCTEAWIKVSGETGSEIILNRDDKEVKRFTLTSSPQTIYDDSLLPNKSYTYQAVTNGEASSKVPVTTLDTTNHNFTWQTFTFGGEGVSSILYDVAIIDENNIWAVGEINIADTSKNGYTSYGAAHWDGNKWELKKIFYKDNDYQGNEFIVNLFNIRGILVFNNSNIWLAAGSVFHWNGVDSFATFSYQTLTTSGLQPGINKLWGASNNNLYGVGNSGTIIHYQNGQWSKIESGTKLSFQDIWGDKDQILAVASEKFSTGGQYLVRIDGNSTTHLNDIITPAVSLSGIWFIADRKYYLVGDGIYSKHSLDENRWQFDSIITRIKYYPYSISGNALNDVALCSEGSTIAHFNGMNWNISRVSDQYDRLLSIKMKNNLIISVGERFTNTINNQAVILIGRRC